ncbi:hypothetical protein HIM_11061 [Hirsutella minnesotensis 3608]|uniref:Cytochrome P450 n=1 Tax=Hirsutella minnesotensis 3608 TaxID=1043627 RepID=A0A0F7ZRG0_9HYPO|nr:hypothetical protein HIM_11061 [Hirsutella minnesotensis 3608]
MNGFEWQDQRGVEGTGFVRAIRSRLTSRLPQLDTALDRVIRSGLEAELGNSSRHGHVCINLFPMVRRIVTRVNCFVFFGDELRQNEEFTAAALSFPQDVIIAAEFVRITPQFLRPFVASLVTGRHRAAKTLYRYLEPIVSKRLAKRNSTDEWERKQPADCMQWLIDTSPRKKPWSSARMVGEIIAIWLSSVHQLAMTATYAIEDLCLHSKYVEPVRKEVQQQMAQGLATPMAVETLPLLDSFLKESIRHTNLDAITCRRKALKDFVFKDGTAIQKDEWVCIPQRAMMHDAQRYSDPHSFDGLRFARANDALAKGQVTDAVPDKAQSSLTTSNIDWPIWGLGNTACPGRFYASLVLKLMMSQILCEWECSMPDTTSPRSLSWRSSVVPREGTQVMFRRAGTWA